MKSREIRRRTLDGYVRCPVAVRDVGIEDCLACEAVRSVQPRSGGGTGVRCTPKLAAPAWLDHPAEAGARLA
jgi:hypothetical protein